MSAPDEETRMMIMVGPGIRLRAFDPEHADVALLQQLLVWYQDQETVRLVDGPGAELYDLAKLRRMYQYMHDHGELYLVERLCDDHWVPIGDVGLQTHAIPIVLAPDHRGQGIGTLVIKSLVERARNLGWQSVEVSEIYSYNVASRRLYESLGFVVVGETEHGHRYRLDLAHAAPEG